MADLVIFEAIRYSISPSLYSLPLTPSVNSLGSKASMTGIFAASARAVSAFRPSCEASLGMEHLT